MSAKAVLGTRNLVDGTPPTSRARSRQPRPGRAVGLLGADGWGLSGPVDTTARPAPEGVDRGDDVHLEHHGLLKAVVHTENTSVPGTTGSRTGSGLTGMVRSSCRRWGHSVGAWHGRWWLALYTGAPLVLLGPLGSRTRTRPGGPLRCPTAAATPFPRRSRRRDAVRLGDLRTFLSAVGAGPALLDGRGHRPRTGDVVHRPVGHDRGVSHHVPAGSMSTVRAIGPSACRRWLELHRRDDTGEPEMRGPRSVPRYLNQDGLFRAQLTPDRYFLNGR
ncbi:hypothetical protein HBB16_01520 [Pseudonocardia sp. MCCB 268]|nr:hypothetical protein [Pseudonocardia cytotoxica]